MHKHLYKRETRGTNVTINVQCLFCIEYTKLGCVSALYVFGKKVYARVGNRVELFGKVIKDA